MKLEETFSSKLKYEPRKWQLLALEKWERDYRGIISVVTGGGKTVFAFLCIDAYKKKYPDRKILIVVPTITLLDQWFVSLQDEFGVKKDDIFCFSGTSKPKDFSWINIVVINTARKLIRAIPNKEDFFLIVDECHRTGSPLNGMAIKGTYLATLGLSATPEREYDDGFEKYMSPVLGNIIYTYDYKEALKDGVICLYELVNVKVDLLEHEKTKYDQLSRRILSLKKSRDFNHENIDQKEKLNMLLIKRARISSSALMRLPVTSKLAEQNKNERIIIFHESIDEANLIYKALSERNNNITIYHSNIGINLRRDNLRLYRNGSYRILVTCKALDEGMNAPETTVAIIASSTASSRQRIQRLGRVLRPAKNKEKAVIYTLYATDAEKQRLIEEYKTISDEIKISWFKSSKLDGKNFS